MFNECELEKKNNNMFVEISLRFIYIKLNLPIIWPSSERGREEAHYTDELKLNEIKEKDEKIITCMFTGHESVERSPSTTCMLASL